MRWAQRVLLSRLHFDDLAQVPQGCALLQSLFFLGLSFVRCLYCVTATVHAGDVAAPAVFIFNDGWALTAWTV